MNSQSDDSQPQADSNEPLLEEAPTSPPNPENGHPAAPPPTDHKHRRPGGKVARMPKTARDQLNVMLRDGLPYAEIIAKLGEPAKGLIPRNISNWHRGAGYQRWEKDQEWVEDLRSEQEAGLDLLPDFDAGKLNEAALQVAVTHLFRAFRHLSSGGLKDALGGDPQSFARLVNALARASRETINLQKHREACAKARAAIQSLRDPKHKLTEDERRSLVLLVDDILGLPRQHEPAKTLAPDPLTTDHRPPTTDNGQLNTEY